MVRVKFILVAQVDDEMVFKSSYPDTVMLEEELYKAERAVEKALIDEEDDEI
jgi:hypothetical protein